MKKFNKITIFLLLLFGFAINSCDEVLDLELLDNPNEITLEKADLDRFLVAIQVSFQDFVYDMGVNSAEVVRLEQMYSQQYITAYGPANLDTEWETAYQEMFSDMDAAEALAMASESNKHIGVMKVLKAYVLMTLVDFWGDVPLSEALQPEEFPFPNADDDAAVYDHAMNLLDSAISYLESDGNGLSVDLFYQNDFDKWINLANTLKMKAYVNTRLVDADAVNKFNAIVGSGNYITSTADDFEFQYGTIQDDPNTRHDAYDDDYTDIGAANYRSNWLMNEMYYNDDPRTRYYFYRQVDYTPGANGEPGNQADLPCSVQSRPTHYPADMIFCAVGDGYWGRDHGNAEGIPPDATKRTTVGVYPAGGKFDDDEFATASLGSGGAGAGILPIMLASWVDLMKAEMAMVSNPSNGNTHLQASLDKSIAKVMTSINWDPGADASFAPTAADVSNYVTNTISDFNGASTEDKWEIFANEVLISHYGNGIDAYNFYRRTGYPHSLQYTVVPNEGPFIRTFLYPASEANTNGNIIQRSDVKTQVFWDNNPAHPTFPVAN